MRSFRLPRIMLCLSALILPCFCVAVEFAGGTGEPNDPYRIATAEQLIGLGEDLSLYDKCFILTADIDLDPNLPGGRVFDRAVIAPDRHPSFTGVFDGNGYTISHLAIVGKNSLGLFGHSNTGAVISNLGLEAINVHGTGGTGYPVGGIVGSNDGSITSSYSTGVVTGADGGIGGLAGSSRGSIRSCYSTAKVSGSSWVGGLVGSVSGEGDGVSDCRFEGIVTGNNYVGGLIGELHDTTVTRCYAEADVSGSMGVGGLVGENCCGFVINCYAGGSVAGGSRVGGLVGGNEYGSQAGGYFRMGPEIGYSYSTSVVTGTSPGGGLVGFNEGLVRDSYWDTETSGQLTSDGGTGKTTAEMKTTHTFLPYWGCDSVWTIDEGMDYPRLKWEQRAGQVLSAQLLSDFVTGSGEPNDPYLIYTAEELNLIALFPCEFNSNFKLMTDIDLSIYTGREFSIIGLRTRDGGYPFTGVFDGNGYRILNFTYRAENMSVGLFGCVSDPNAEIRNLGLINPHIDVNNGPGGALVGSLGGGRLVNCYVQGGFISGGYAAGGLVGAGGGGGISNCYSSCSVLGDGDVGGLVGYNQGWYGFTTILNCYSTGMVTGGVSVGGLVGSGGAGITSSFWDIETSGQTTSAGGTGLITVGMQIARVFLEAGWDFIDETDNGIEDIWWIEEGQDYPKLWWEET